MVSAAYTERAPERITQAISIAEHGDFQLSIGDLQRAETGKLVWTMRGRIGERGVAWYAPPTGTPIKPFDPSKPDGAPRKLLDSSLLQSLGWRPRIGLAEGLRKAYVWYLENAV